MSDKTTIKLLGKFSTDSGIVWIGDPCYIIHKDEQDAPKSIGQNWEDFSNIMSDSVYKSFKHDAGHDGLGLGVASMGDGTFPVIGSFNGDNRLRFIIIDFMNIFKGKYESGDDKSSDDMMKEEVDPTKFKW